MYNLNFVTPKKHFLARNRIIWAIVHQNQFSCFSFKGRQEKKEREGKERKGTKSHASVIFHLFVGKPPWTDFHQILHIKRYAGCNHLCKFWCGKIKGFGTNGGSNFGFSHWNGWSLLQQCCATAHLRANPSKSCRVQTTESNLSL